MGGAKLAQVHEIERAILSCAEVAERVECLLGGCRASTKDKQMTMYFLSRLSSEASSYSQVSQLLYRESGTLRQISRLARKRWRRGSGSNRRIKVVQTFALPLGYRAV